MKPILFCLVCMVVYPAIAFAHPISQGAIDVYLSPSKLHVRARVPVEEVFIANALATPTMTASHTDAWRDHGTYFLRHFTVTADNRALTGTMTHWSEGGGNHIIYDFDYPVSALPAQLAFRQNLLNEYLFAPGNPWEATFIVRIKQQGQLLQEGLLLTSKQALIVSNRTLSHGQTQQSRFMDFFRHGVMHILSGYDHLLFIIALVLTTVTVLDLIKVVTAFTIAHTVTLTLSVLGFVRLSSLVVEPMIAASIVFVAIANVIWPHQTRGRLRCAIAFFFGLFHGLGFAGGLIDAMTGMSGLAVSIAILAFSLGVELGHQLVVLPVFAGLRRLRSARSDDVGQNRFSILLVRMGSLLISVAGTVYLSAALK